MEILHCHIYVVVGGAGHILRSRNMYLIQVHYSRSMKVNSKICVVMLGKTCPLSNEVKLLGHKPRATMWETPTQELN